MVNDNESQQDEQVEGAQTQQSVEELLKALEDAQGSATDAKDKMLRSEAEAQNMRRRAKLDIENAHKYSIEKLAKELLHVVDSLEKGLEAATVAEQQADGMRQGMELTHKLLLSTLEKFHIHQVNPIGAPFDPKQHEALTMQETTDAQPNTVLAVIQTGFVIHDRVLRPARVIVAKAPS